MSIGMPPRGHWRVSPAIRHPRRGIFQPEAIGLFERCGYTQCPVFGDYPKNDPLSYFMRKTLEEDA